MARRLFVVMAVLATSAVSLVGQSKPSVQGVWRVVENVTTGPTAYANKNPQPGLIIFTGKHYAIVRDTARQPRPPVKDAANPTASEALASYQNFMAQAGTYEATSATLTFKPMVAKNPPAGGKYENTFTYSMKLDGNNLTLIQVSGSARGKTPNPGTIRLTRLE